MSGRMGIGEAMFDGSSWTAMKHDFKRIAYE